MRDRGEILAMVATRLPPAGVDLVDRAKTMPKGDYRAYAECMRALFALRLSQSQFEDAQRELIEILEV